MMIDLRIEAANMTLGVREGRIVEPDRHHTHVVAARRALLHPGLINAHDHLHRNHYGRLGDGPYQNAYAWVRDTRARHGAKIEQGRSLPRRTALLCGAWKNLLSGVTHVVHHDRWEEDFDADFPLRVVRLETADSLGLEPDFNPAPAGLFALHLAEGIDAVAAEEVRTLHRRGLLGERLLAVHAVGPDKDGIALLRNSGCAVVCCPTSNRFLFGRTAPADLLADGMDVLLGTDSLLTGEGSLLAELAAARGIIGDDRLLASVGEVAARRLAIAQPSLSVGSPADLVLLRRPLLEASLDDVALVMVGGHLRVLDMELAEALRPSGGQIVELYGVRRWISGPV